VRGAEPCGSPWALWRWRDGLQGVPPRTA